MTSFPPKPVVIASSASTADYAVSVCVLAPLLMGGSARKKGKPVADMRTTCEDNVIGQKAMLFIVGSEKTATLFGFSRTSVDTEGLVGDISRVASSRTV